MLETIFQFFMKIFEVVTNYLNICIMLPKKISPEIKSNKTFSEHELR